MTVYMTQLLSAVDCGALMNPTNGQVDTSSGTTFVDRATYTCNIGHNRVGTSSRTCLASGIWSSVQPTCKGKIKPLGSYTIQYSTEQLLTVEHLKTPHMAKL